MSLEYTLLEAGGLDYHPEPWTPVDSLSWLEAMAWDLRGNMDDEINRVLDLQGHTRAQVDQLYPRYDYRLHPPIVEQGAVVDGTFQQDVTGRGLPSRGAAGVRRGRARRAEPGGTRSGPPPAAARARRRHRQQQLGRRRRPHDDR